MSEDRWNELFERLSRIERLIIDGPQEPQTDGESNDVSALWPRFPKALSFDADGWSSVHHVSGGCWSLGAYKLRLALATHPSPHRRSLLAHPIMNAAVCGTFSPTRRRVLEMGDLSAFHDLEFNVNEVLFRERLLGKGGPPLGPRFDHAWAPPPALDYSVNYTEDGRFKGANPGKVIPGAIVVPTPGDFTDQNFVSRLRAFAYSYLQLGPPNFDNWMSQFQPPR